MAVLVHCAGCGAEFRSLAKHRGRETRCAHCDEPLVIDGPAIPDHDVFISYSSADKLAADAICAALEAKRWRCWIAPRNVLAGSDWGAAIVQAIEQSRLMLLVYSANANQSQQVLREIERAVSKGLPIIPFRIEAAEPSKNMEYFLSTSHWMDAMTEPLERHIEQLAESVRRILTARRETSEGDRPPPSGNLLVPGPAPGAAAWRRRWAAAVAVVALALGAAAAAVVFRGAPEQGVNAATLQAAPAPATAPAAATQPAGITERVVLVPSQGFRLKRGYRDDRYPVSVPRIASGSGWLQIRLTDMGDDSGDGGMYCLLLDARGEVVFRRFGRVTVMFTHQVRSQTSWTVVLQDYDTRGSGNGGGIEVAIAPE